MKRHNRRSPYTTKSSRIAWSCPWYHVREDRIVTPDGRDGVYNVVEKKDAVWIVPVTVAREVVLIYNYRYTVDDWCWEVPAGSLEPEHPDLEETARAELRQEVGGIAEEIHYITDFYVANGIFNETGHLFLATDVQLGSPSHESTEVMEVHCKSIDETLRMTRSGEIKDGPSALALLLCAPRLLELVSN